MCPATLIVRQTMAVGTPVVPAILVVLLTLLGYRWYPQYTVYEIYREFNQEMYHAKVDIYDR